MRWPKTWDDYARIVIDGQVELYVEEAKKLFTEDEAEAFALALSVAKWWVAKNRLGKDGFFENDDYAFDSELWKNCGCCVYYGFDKSRCDLNYFESCRECKLSNGEDVSCLRFLKK